MPRDKKTNENNALLQGTLDLLVLKSLSRNGVMHGYGIARFIQQISREALRLEEGSLYPALHRLELEDLILSEWGHGASGRRAKYYRLSPRGRKRLEAEESRWRRMVEAIGLVLEPAEG
ncbi:MAG TPA: PadR family transcriptional regulator [Bryobacteraceae bacterium]|nr:PadR family transcriptional regulator [Bryobacteraceae bacterium]